MGLPNLSRLSLNQADTGPRLGTTNPEIAKRDSRYVLLSFGPKEDTPAKKARLTPTPPPPPPPPPSHAAPSKSEESEESEESETDEAPRIKVYSAWVGNATDNRSITYIREMRCKPGDRYAQTDYVEVEVACNLFMKLSGADTSFNNPKGEPTDWDFTDPERHKVYSDSEAGRAPLKVDQPWLLASWNSGRDRYDIYEHEGRHRVAWICNHLSEYTHLTILIGLKWEDRADEKYAAPDDGTVFREQVEGGPLGTRFAMLEKNDREGHLTKYRLVKA